MIKNNEENKDIVLKKTVWHASFKIRNIHINNGMIDTLIKQIGENNFKLESCQKLMMKKLIKESGLVKSTEIKNNNSKWKKGKK